jgi:hypothetical protein
VLALVQPKVPTISAPLINTGMNFLISSSLLEYFQRLIRLAERHKGISLKQNT